MSKRAAYDKIDVLDEIEWLHLRPETFIGSLEHATHLFEEVLDNSLDEVLNESANLIEIRIDTKKNICKIEDNGRGIPYDVDKTDKVSYLVKACTKLFSSGKFEKDNVSFYKNSIGLNGIGLVAVTAFSEYALVTSSRNGYSYTFLFETDFNKHKINYKFIKKEKTKKNGTYIEFKPSTKIFKNAGFDLEFIKLRLSLVKFLFKDLRIRLYIDEKEISIESSEEYIFNLFFKEKVKKNDIKRIECSEGTDKVILYFYYQNDKIDNKLKGVVNLLPVHRGTHIKFAKDVLERALKDLAKTANIGLIGFRCLSVVFLKDKRFSGQIKEQLEVDNSALKMKFAKKMKKQVKSVLSEILNIEEYIKRFSHLNVIDKSDIKEFRKKRYIKNLLDCIDEKGETKLFIVEGDSAAGSLIKCRNKKTDAIYALIGKSLPNVEKFKKVFQNKVILDLFTIFNKDLESGSEYDIKNLKYDKIIIATDPDIDGYHISVLLLKFFKKFFPVLIEKGKIYISQIPLYGYWRDGFEPIYDINEAEKLLNEKKYHLIRYKGLGEFDSSELKIILFEKPNFIKITTKNIEKNIKTMEEVLKKRKKIKEKELNIFDISFEDLLKSDGNKCFF